MQLEMVYENMVFGGLLGEWCSLEYTKINGHNLFLNLQLQFFSLWYRVRKTQVTQRNQSNTNAHLEPTTERAHWVNRRVYQVAPQNLLAPASHHRTRRYAKALWSGRVGNGKRLTITSLTMMRLLIMLWRKGRRVTGKNRRRKLWRKVSGSCAIDGW